MNRSLRIYVEAVASGRAPPDALVARARGELDRDQAARARRLARSLPRRRAEAAEDQLAADEWDAIKAGVRARSHGRCEFEVSGKRCPVNVAADLECHHIWNGFGRRVVLQSVESCMDLCERHHRDAPSKPTRAFWLALYREHFARHGYRSQLAELERAEALLAAKKGAVR